MKQTTKGVVIESSDFFQREKPRFNGYSCGYGLHGKTKYSRKQKHKEDYHAL